MDCRPPGSSIHGIFQARVLEWGAIAFSVRAGRRGQIQGSDILPELTGLPLANCSLLDEATSLSLFTFHFPALEKEMATHSSVLAWRIPGMGEPGGLPSMGSHRVGHD